jgi:DNA-binding SARP family transcriptional activator
MVVLKLFGSSSVWINGSEITDLSSKARALLVYLAQSHQSHHRTHIANLLWTDKHDSHALANLRGILHELKQLSTTHKAPLIETDRKTLKISSTTRFTVDTHTFDNLLNTAKDTTGLQQAIEHYQGAFISGLSIRGADAFEDWMTEVRSSLHDKYIKALETLAGQLMASGSSDQALQYLQAIVHSEPYREDIHLQLMQQYAKQGLRANAILQFETCREVLARDLNTTPSRVLVDLYRELSNGAETLTQPGPAVIQKSATHKFIVGPPISATEHFYGRNDCLGRIFGLWQQPPLGHVAIIGQRRSGKTSLLKHLRPISGNHAVTRSVHQRKQWLNESEIYRWIFIDFQDPRMRSLPTLLSHMLHGFDVDAPHNCTLEQFMDLAAQKPWQAPTLILMDELDAGLSADELDQSFWWAMRALTQMTDGFLGIVVASYEPPMNAADRLDKSSPFFNIFNTLELGPLEEYEAIDFIDSIDQTYSDEERQWVLDQSGRWPCLLQLLCQEKYIATSNHNGPSGWRENALRQLQHYAYLLQ